MRIRLDVEPSAMLLAAAGLLILPFDWLLSGILAAAVHEMGHLAALAYFGIRISELKIRAGGAVITTGYLPPIQEIISAAAGPLFSFLLVFLWRWFPAVALFGFVQGMFNLIPIYPLDGGRILGCLLALLLPDLADLILKIIGILSKCFVISFLLLMDMPGWAIMIALFGVNRHLSEKYLAKRRRNDYNGSD